MALKVYPWLFLVWLSLAFFLDSGRNGFQATSRNEVRAFSN